MDRKTKYRIGRIRQLADGAWLAAISEVGYPRTRRQFKTQAEARTFIDLEVVRRAHDTHQPLTAVQILDAQAAFALLPDGVTLAQAVGGFLMHRKTVTPIATADACREFVAEKAAAGRRPETISAYQVYLGPLEREYGAVDLHAIETPVLVAWLDATGQQAVSRNNYRRHWLALFEWAVQRSYAAENPARAIMVASVQHRPPGILTPEETARLLTTAAEHDAELVASLAIGAFAGIRPREIQRLRWPQTGDYIEVGAEASKTRERRLVTICAALRAWLDAYPVPGCLCGKNYRHRMDAVRAAAGVPWSKDCLRHSFATYHLALYRDFALTEHEMGHTDREMLLNHYRNLATKEQGAAYFSILPPTISGSKMAGIQISKS